MSLKSNNKVETNKYELEVAVDGAAFEAAVEKAYLKNRKNVRLQGFRPGKAPRKMIEKMYGEGVFFEDAVNSLVPDFIPQAIEEAALDIVARPEIDVVSVDKNDGVVFKVTCITKPEVSVSDYKGIEAVKNVKTVSDEDVDKQIESVRERNGRTVTVEGRAAQDGDTVVFDFEGFKDGVAFDGGKADSFELKLGSGQFIPGFEDQVVGKNVDEPFEVNVTFPEDYAMKELAGQPAVFKCLIHEIKAVELPDVDDEFVKDVSEFDTVDEYKADIKAKMTERAEKAADAEVENAIFDAVISKLEAEIPDVMIENKIDDFVADFNARLSQQGLNLDTYLEYTGSDMDKFRASYKEQAEKNVKLRLALEKIAEIEGITASDADVEEEINKIAEMYGMKAEDVKESISNDVLADDIKIKKASDFVKENAKIS